MPDQVDWRTMEHDASAGHAVGRLLRNQREARGLSIEDVARNLRIRRPYIEAIEQGRFEQLPGAAYIPAFLRAYARHIGLDPAKVLTAYQLSGSVPIERPVALPADFPLAEKRAPIGLFVLTILLVVGAGYGVWHYLPRQQTVVAEKVPPVPDRLLATRPANEVAREVARAQAPASPPATAPTAAPVAETVAVAPAPQSTPSTPQQASPQPARDTHMWPAPRQEAQLPPPPPPAVIAVPAAPPPAVMTAPSVGQALAAQPPAIETQRNNTPASAEPQEAVVRPAPPETVARPAVAPVVPPAESVARPAPIENADNAAPPSAPTRADTQIMVRANSWVELRSAAGDVLAQTYVRAGESYVVPAGIAYRIIAATR
jgi:cytoskeleton protein RodZ